MKEKILPTEPTAKSEVATHATKAVGKQIAASKPPKLNICLLHACQCMQNNKLKL